MSIKSFTNYTASGNTTAVTNASAIVAFDAVAGKRHYLHYVGASLTSGNFTGGALIYIKKADDIVWRIHTKTSGLNEPNIPVLVGGLGSAMSVTVTPGGAGTTCYLNAYAYTK